MLTSKKAQALTYDFFIAIAILLIAFAIIISYWYYSAIQMQETEKRNQATNTLFQASQAWFKEGYPKYWGTTDILEIGMSNENRINRTKMEMLPQLGYSRVVSLLSLGTYNLQYTVYNSSDDIIFQFPSGTDLVSAKNIYKVERIGILDEKVVNIRTIIWD